MDTLASPADVDWALKSIQIDRQVLMGPPIFLPLTTTATFVEALARRTGEKHLGALIGQHSEYVNLSSYSDFVLAAPNLIAALQRASKALPVLNPGCRVSFNTQEGHLIPLLHFGIQNVVGAHHLDEFVTMFMIDLVRHFLGSHWSPEWVELSNGSINGRRNLEAIYGVSIVFRPGAAGVAVRLEDLTAPNPRRTPADQAILLRDLPGLIGVSPPPQSFSEVVVEILRLQILLGDSSIEAVAERLSVGVRSLQRRLRVEGTSFQELRSECLKARAIDLLTETGRSVAEIARTLGYAETNSFRRVFREWYSVTPTQFRLKKTPIDKPRPPEARL